MPGVRFAPSPTGRFHLGNLRTAWISWRWSRRLGEPWVVRFEDIDRPRVLPGAREGQLQDLEELGMAPDRVYDQWSRRDRHFELFSLAHKAGRVYPCYCSRKEVQESLAGLASAPHGSGAVYDGRCRPDRDPARAGTINRMRPTVAWRLLDADASGRHDFIVARTDQTEPDPGSFVPAYHWACAIDDRDGGYHLLVRAWDLESAAEQQRAVHRLADALERRDGPLPAIYHCALVTRDDGGRLEKRTLGVTLAELRARGVGPQRVIEAFRASYAEQELEAAFSASRVWGEPRRTITLSSLGL